MATIYTRNVYLVVGNADLAQANALALQIDPTTGPNTFSIPCSASGNLPATHWACSWVMTQAQWDSTTTRFTTLEAQGRAWRCDADLQTLDQAVASIGLLKAQNDGIQE